MFQAKVIADSISPLGQRITTIEATYPRFIHAEIMTHRDRARNAGSSRAIPWPTMQRAIIDDPVVPIKWGAEQSGMQTGGEIEDTEAARIIWLRLKTQAIQAAQELATLGVHKSLCNRLTEPFMWITVVMTSTCWRNFFNQRCHKDAEIHMQEIAYLIRQEILKSEPNETMYHLPYVQDDDRGTNESARINKMPEDAPFEVLFQVSTARCARVSFVQHGEKAKSIEKDLGLFDRLLAGSAGGHWSPFEHPSIAFDGRSGPYTGWKGYRKFFLTECPEEGYPTATEAVSAEPA
jgi:hypothetical protein